MSFGRFKWRLDRLWGYFKYIQAAISIITLAIVSGWPFWFWSIGGLIVMLGGVFLVRLDDRYVYPQESNEAFKHFKDDIRHLSGT